MSNTFQEFYSSNNALCVVLFAERAVLVLVL